MKNRFSFEIYKEVSAADTSLEPVVAGIHSLRDIIGDVDIVENQALLQFPDVDNERLRVHEYGIKHLADFAIILTTKPIGDIDERTRGITYSYPNGQTLGLRNTILSTYDNLNLESTTEHEVGHLFNMAHGGETHDGDGHCNEKDCMMHPSIDRHIERTRNIYVDANGTEHLISEEVREYTLKKDLCRVCDSLFSLNAEILMDAKQGKSVPDKLLFAARAHAGIL